MHRNLASRRASLSALLVAFDDFSELVDFAEFDVFSELADFAESDNFSDFDEFSRFC